MGSRLAGRVRTLEERQGPADIYKYPWHRITREEWQSEAEAIDAYGRDKIGPNDNLIVTTLVSPKFDAEGKMILQEYPKCGLRVGNGPMGYGGLGGDNGTA